MKGITVGLLVAAGVAGLWAAQRAIATRHTAPTYLAQAQRSSAQPASTATAAPQPSTPPKDAIDPQLVKQPKGDIDPQMVKRPKGDIDPQMVVNPPPPRAPEDRPSIKPRPQ